MHDRKNAGLLEISLLGFPVILKESPHTAGTAKKAGGHARRVERIDLARIEHLRERFAFGNRLDPNRRRQRQLDFLLAARLFLSPGKVARAGDGHRVLVAQNAANPYRRGQLIFGTTDVFPDEVLGLAYAAVLIDEDAGMPERA